MLVIKRTHGIGHLVCLIPVVRELMRVGVDVQVLTNPAWIVGLYEAARDIHWVEAADHVDHDLDLPSQDAYPTMHKSKEWARQLGVSGHLHSPRLKLVGACVRQGLSVFAPEAEHSGRACPPKLAQEIINLLTPGVRLVGLRREPKYVACVDTRGTTTLSGLLRMLSEAPVVVAMDSGVMHLAAALDVPTVALFGGVDPVFRVGCYQNVVALQADIGCCPCNKRETCGGDYVCLRNISAGDVAAAIARVVGGSRREIWRVTQ